MPIAEDTRRLCHDIASFHKEVRDGLIQRGDRLRSALAEGERQRLEAASDFASTLAGEVKQRTRDVGRMLGGFRKELAGFRKENRQRAVSVREFLGEVREDMLAAGGAWRGMAGKLSRSRPPAPREPGPAGSTGPSSSSPSRSGSAKERQILNVVMGHPRGLKLTDIGKMLGTDWRSLNTPTRGLVATGKLRKVNNLYFAV